MDVCAANWERYYVGYFIIFTCYIWIILVTFILWCYALALLLIGQSSQADLSRGWVVLVNWYAGTYSILQSLSMLVTTWPFSCFFFSSKYSLYNSGFLRMSTWYFSKKDNLLFVLNVLGSTELSSPWLFHSFAWEMGGNAFIHCLGDNILGMALIHGRIFPQNENCSSCRETSWNIMLIIYLVN